MAVSISSNIDIPNNRLLKVIIAENMVYVVSALHVELYIFNFAVDSAPTYIILFCFHTTHITASVFFLFYR